MTRQVKAFPTADLIPGTYVVDGELILEIL